jgi:uncharacterized membrane protein
MPGLYANLVGGIVIVALVIVGLWLTWISLRSEQHRPAALEPADPDETE